MTQQLIEDFLAWKAAGCTAPSTIRQRRAILTKFERFYPIETATPDQITEYLLRPSRGDHARRQVLTALRTLYRWATATGTIEHDPTALLHPIRRPHALPRPAPTHAIHTGLAQADEETQCMVLLGYRAGLRLSEITALHETSITDLGLHIVGKGDRPRLIPIHADLRPHLANFTGWRFPSPRFTDRHVHSDYIADRIKNATGHTPHTLRHRFATDVYATTGDLRSLQILMGHSSIQTTQMYVAVADDRLSTVINALH